MTDNKIRTSPIAHAVGCVLALFTSTLQAQDATPDQQDESAERVLVTGSLIRRSEFKSEQPVDIISADSAAAAGMTNVGQLLRSITVASGSPQITAATSTEFVVNGGDGAESIGLRGLGANRTLVLLNGRRAGPAGTRGGTSSFDFNVLPISAIDRVEILKDGASSLYGSDAIAGVINIITKKGDGGELDINVSRPEDRGGETNRFSATWGASNDKGSLRVVLDYDQQKELARGQRDYLTCGRRNIYNTETGASADPIDPRTGKPHCFDLLWGQVWIYDYQTENGDITGGNVPTSDVRTLAQFDYNGELSSIPGMAAYAIPNSYDPLNPGYMYAPAGWYFVRHNAFTDGVTNASHPFQDQQSLIPESTRTTVFAQGDYQFGNDVTGYAELLLNRRKSKINSYLQFWSYVYSETSHFVDHDDDPETPDIIETDSGGNPMSAGWGGAQWYSPTAITDHADSGTEVDYVRTVAGLNGSWGDWFWDMSYQYSRSKGIYFNDELYGDRIWDQNFLDGSCVGMTHSVSGGDCQDIPWLDPEFLRGNLSPEMQAYLFTQQRGKTIYEQSSFEFVTSGDLMTLPAGPLGMAAGVHFRKDKINDTPGDIWLEANSWYGNAAGITKGDDTTQAIFAETRIPLLAGVTGAELLEVSLSGRYTDVETSGSATTYKASVNWEVGDGFIVRASYGTSFRAPALFELYLADQRSYVGQRGLDPCIEWASALAEGAISQRVADNCAAEGIPDDFTGGAISATVITGGGLGELKPETSTAKTYGVVWNSRDVELSVSLDYFDFLIEDEVTALSAGDIVYQCYDSAYFPSDPLCDLFDRQGPGSDIPDNRIEPVRAKYINIAKQINQGYDFRLTYATETPIGKLTFDTSHTWQEESSEELFPGTVEDKNGQFGDPKHTATYNTTLEYGDWSFNWNVQYFGAVSNVESNNGNIIDYYGTDVRMVLKADSMIYHAFSLTHNFADSGLVATLGVANAFDERPPQVSTYRNDIDRVGDSAFYSQYDFLGRRLFADLSFKF